MGIFSNPLKFRKENNLPAMKLSFLLLATPVLAKIISRNTLCSQEAQFGWSFSGVIVQHQYTVDYPALNHMRVTRCLEGEDRSYDAFRPLPQSQDIKWGKKFCTGHKNKKAACYILARTKVTSRRLVSLYPPGEWVGGIFMCPGHLEDDGVACKNENAVPLWPLVATMPNHYEEIQLSSTVSRVPILRSPGPNDTQAHVPEDWESFIDVFEDYTYQLGDRDQQRLTWDLLINIFRSVSDMAKSPFFPRANRIYFDVGDHRERREVRMLAPRKIYEEDPENLRRVMSENYFRQPVLEGDDFKRAVVSVSATSGPTKKKDRKTPFTVGSLVQLSYHIPRFAYDTLVQAIYSYNTVDSVAVGSNEQRYSHPRRFENPSQELERISGGTGRNI